jgi:hypothetical protein
MLDREEFVRISLDGKLLTSYTHQLRNREPVDYTKFLLAMQENSCSGGGAMLYVLTHFAIMF